MVMRSTLPSFIDTSKIAVYIAFVAAASSTCRLKIRAAGRA